MNYIYLLTYSVMILCLHAEMYAPAEIANLGKDVEI